MLDYSLKCVFFKFHAIFSFSISLTVHTFMISYECSVCFIILVPKQTWAWRHHIFEC